MKFSAVLVSSLIAIVSAIPQEPAASSVQAALTPAQSCIAGCAPADVNCQASCNGAAHPNEDDVNATTACAMECDQGSGSPEDTEAYAACQQGCISSLFPTTQTAAVGGAPAASNAATTPGSPAANPTGAAGSAVSSLASQISAAVSGATSGAAGASPSTGASNNVQMASSAVGFTGLLMAIFAL